MSNSKNVAQNTAATEQVQAHLEFIGKEVTPEGTYLLYNRIYSNGAIDRCSSQLFKTPTEFEDYVKNITTQMTDFRKKLTADFKVIEEDYLKNSDIVSASIRKLTEILND